MNDQTLLARSKIFLKKVLPFSVLNAAEKTAHRLFPETMKNWQHRVDESIRQNTLAPRPESHLLMYWDDVQNPNRKLLMDLIQEELTRIAAEEKRAVKLFEYGSYCGINFRMLLERTGGLPTELFAVEPNAQAVQFSKSKLPSVTVEQLEDEGFVASSFPGPMDISFVNKVFYLMNSARSFSVLEKLARISRSIVIGDDMSNYEGRESYWDRKNNGHIHPYKHWFKTLGFEVVKYLPAPQPYRSISHYLIARRTATR